MRTLIVDSKFNSIPIFTPFTNTLIAYLGGTRQVQYYVLVDKKLSNTSYPPYVITLKEAKAIKGAIYLTTSRSRATAMVASGSRLAIFHDCTAVRLEDRWTCTKYRIIRINTIGGLQRAIQDGTIASFVES